MKHVGRHTIVREIASAEVLSTFEATHDDGRVVRLRVVDAPLELDRLEVKRFEDALSHAAGLRHVGVDRPVAWSAKGPMHVSTLRTSGASLREVCERAPGGRLAVDVAAGVGADVAEALHAAHAAGLVHAGVSPDSILLGTDGQARVTDFGLMRWLNERSATDAQIMRGAIESLSPEQLATPETVGPQTDVFALGLVLYRALTGKPAFEAPSALGVSIRLSMGKPTPIESHDVEIPDELRALVMKMLSAVPDDRPSLDLVIRALTKSAGSWRDSVRSLATAAWRAASGSQPEAESSTPWPETPAPSAAANHALSPLPGAPPEGEPLSSVAADEHPSPSFSASPADAISSPAAPALSPPQRGPSPPPSAPADNTPVPPFPAPIQTIIDPVPSLEQATQPELALPEGSSRDDGATVFELHTPADPGDDPDMTGDVAPAPAGDTSVWPTPDDPGYSVPKTVILKAPSARPSARSAPRLQAPPAPSIAQDVADDDPAEPSDAVAGAPEWAIWTAVALGAFALLVGTATFVILIAN